MKKIFYLISILFLQACSHKSVESKSSANGFKYTEEVIFISSTKDEQIKYETTIFEPEDKTNNTNKPIVVIVHGTNPQQPQPRERSIHPSEFFLEKGWTVILPMRRGYSHSTGERVRLRNCDLKTYGLENAADIAEVIDWIFVTEKYKSRKIILIGQSTGGLTVMAYSSLPNNKVSAIINFHGGMRPQSENDCLWQARIDAFKAYSPTSHPASYWIYTDNDHSSNPAYIGRLYAEFLKSSKGYVQLSQYGSFKKDGHYLFGDKDGGQIWQERVMDFLRKQNITSDVQ